jgi:hypothetical protein
MTEMIEGESAFAAMPTPMSLKEETRDLWRFYARAAT